MTNFNLQLFGGAQDWYANGYGESLNTNVTTDAGLSAENRTFYDKNLIKNAEPNLIYRQFGQKRSIPKTGGKVINFRKYSSLGKAMTPITEGVTPEGQKLTVSAITGTLAQYGGYVTTSDVLDLTAIDNNIVEATSLLGAQAGLTLDSLCRDVVTAGGNVNYCPKIGEGGAETAVSARSGFDATAKLTVKQVQKAVAKLRKNNAKPVDGTYYVGIVHPYVAYDLMRDPEWETASKYGAPEQLFAGEIGRIAGVRFMQSSNAKIFNDETTPEGIAVFATMIIGQDAYGVVDIEGGALKTIVKPLGSAGSADPLDQRATVGWKAMEVTVELTEENMVRIESVSPDYVNTPAN